MANLRIGHLQRVRQPSEQLTQEQVRFRIDLHTQNTFERIESVKTDSGTMALPTMDAEQSAALRQLYGRATPELQERLVRDSHDFAMQLGNAGMEGLNVGEVSGELRGSMNRAIETFVVTTGEQNTENVINGAMLMALDGAQQDVMGLAHQLGSATHNSSLFREDIADFRNTLADWPDGQEAVEFYWHEMDEAGNIVETSGTLNKEQALAKMEELEMNLATIGDMRQEWQLSLQDAMNRQQQAFQILSNIMKMMHDTAKSIIQNVRG